MTIYILGGSTTVMSGGWADSFATQVVRRAPVRNLAIGGGNTLMSLIRLKQEVSLLPDDVVVWASSVRDVMCLNAGGYQDGGLLRYTEELLRYVADAGARFVPVLIDTMARGMDLRQAGYKKKLLDLLSHYGLHWIDVTSEFTRETGLPRIPLHFYDATGHIAAGSDMAHFMADLVSEAISVGLGHVDEAAPLFVDPDRPSHVVSEFGPDNLSERFENRLLTQTLWKPGLSLVPGMRPDGAVDLEALLVMADPAGGAFKLKAPGISLTMSAGCAVDYYNGPMMLTAYLPDLIETPLHLGPQAELRLDWATSKKDLRADLLFHSEPAIQETGARLVAMVFRAAA